MVSVSFTRVEFVRQGRARLAHASSLAYDITWKKTQLTEAMFFLVELTAKTLQYHQLQRKEGIKACRAQQQQRPISSSRQRRAPCELLVQHLARRGWHNPLSLQRCTQAACCCCDVHELTGWSTRPRNSQTRLCVSSRYHRPDYVPLLIAKTRDLRGITS